jgi:hypothetical protein
MGIARGPKIVTSGLVLALDAADKNSYDGNIIVYSVQCYSTYSVSLRSSNYTVQYSDDNSNWTTAFTGVMSNNSSCGIITGTGVNTSNLTAHKYWRYVEGSAVTLHHPRVSRIDFITPNGSVYNLITYTSDNCADSGTVAVGTVSKQFTPSNWRDLSGNNNTGTLTNGPTFSTANMGSIVFDGVDDYVTSPTSTSFNFGTGDFTVEMWVYPTAVKGFSLLDFRINETNPNGNAFVIATSTSSPLYAWVVYQGGNQIVGPTVVANQWVQLIVNRVGTSVKMFLNGVQIGSTWTTSNTFTDGAFVLGTDYPLNARFFQGNVSSIKVYKSKGLTSDEIRQNYNAVKGRYGL